MDALQALHTRVSSPKLGEESPSEESLQNIFKAALRAPDHGQLRPWRFLVINGDARGALGDLFARAALADDDSISEQALEKVRNKPFRGAMIVITIARTTPHPKVPEMEQVISAGAAVQNMLIAAHAQGVGAMWRTGSMAYHSVVEEGLGLESNEKIVGYLYLGQIEGRTRNAPSLDVNEYFQQWP